jgi:hypothetical protein
MVSCKTCERIPGYGSWTCPDCGTNWDFFEGHVIAIKPGYLQPDLTVAELTAEEWATVLAARKTKE